MAVATITTVGEAIEVGWAVSEDGGRPQLLVGVLGGSG